MYSLAISTFNDESELNLIHVTGGFRNCRKRFDRRRQWRAYILQGRLSDLQLASDISTQGH